MSHSYMIRGAKKLHGTIRTSGAKNEALKALAATILFGEPVVITNVPEIEDIKSMIEILERLGARITRNGDRVTVDASTITESDIPRDLATKIRASVVLLGPLLARFKHVTLPDPGGDTIGKRPIDFFLEAFIRMGATFTKTATGYVGTAKKLNGTTIFFPQVSHTATESLMMAATRINGTTILKNCAMEPEVVALAKNLRNAGAAIEGEGTPTITITGVKALKAPKRWEISPDRIEAGTFLIMAAITRSDVTVTNCNPEHLSALLLEFDHIGIPFTSTPSTISVKPTVKRKRATTIKTHEYPGFPTDLQPQIAVLCTQSDGMSLIHETIFEGRLHFLETLKKFGANVILFDPHRAAIIGSTPLRGTTVESPDIRAGVAFVIAALAAKGVTTIRNTYQIQRGYERLVERLAKIGANIQEVEECA